MDQGRVLLVEEDLDALDVAVDAEQNEEVITLSLILVEVRYEQNAAGSGLGSSDGRLKLAVDTQTSETGRPGANAHATGP